MSETLQMDPEKAAAAVQAMVANDSAKAPSIAAPDPGFVTLPAGLEVVNDGVKTVEQDAEVRELTGEDEEFVDRVRRGNPGQLVSALLERGVVSIGGRPAPKHVLRNLLVGDAQALLVALRVATYGDEFSYEGIVCPSCGEEFDLTFTADEIPTVKSEGKRAFDVHLRNGKIAHCRLLRLGDVESLPAEGTKAEYNTVLLSKVVLSLEDPAGNLVGVSGSPDKARSLSLADRRKILVALGEQGIAGPDLEGMSVTHETCRKEVSLPLTVGDLFPGL